MRLFQPSAGWRQLAVVAVASGWVAHAAAQSGPAAHDPLQNESAPMHSATDASADAVPSPSSLAPAKGKKHSKTKAAAPQASPQPEFSVDAPFVGGLHFLTAGTYVLTAVEPVAGPTLQLALHDDRFIVDTTWVVWPESPFGNWAHFEDFGASFGKTPELSLLAGNAPKVPIFVDGFDGVVPGVSGMRRTIKPMSPLVHRPLRKPLPTQLVGRAVR